MITIKIELTYDPIVNGTMVRFLYKLLKVLRKFKGVQSSLRIETDRDVINIPSIKLKVCNFLKVPIKSIDIESRKREIVEARQISMFFSKELTKKSLADIGLECGDKDHATVLHACKTINNLIQTDKLMKAKIETLRGMIK